MEPGPFGVETITKELHDPSTEFLGLKQRRKKKDLSASFKKMQKFMFQILKRYNLEMDNYRQCFVLRTETEVKKKL